MAWLRVDDSFTEHRKIVALKRSDRWTWLELLTYVARQNNGGHIPAGICDVLRWVTPAFLDRCVELGLIDRTLTGLDVHDWDVYNPKDTTHAERQRRYRERQRDADRDVTGDVTRDGQRDDLRDGESDAPRAGTRARPVPSPTPTSPTAATAPRTDPHPAAAAATLERLRTAGWNDRQLTAAEHDPDRALRLLTHAEADPTCQRPGALAWSKYDAGDDTPEAATTRPRTVYPCPHCTSESKTQEDLDAHLENAHQAEPAPPPAWTPPDHDDEEPGPPEAAAA